MAQAVVALVAIAVLVIMSMRANQRFRDHDRLPMQMDWNGAATWTAPRILALLFTPMLSVLVLGLAVAGTIVSEPRAGQEGLEVPVVLMLALGLIAAHALHLRFIARLLRNSGR